VFSYRKIRGFESHPLHFDPFPFLYVEFIMSDSTQSIRVDAPPPVASASRSSALGDPLLSYSVSVLRVWGESHPFGAKLFFWS
jgi:hypothetical protein